MNDTSRFNSEIESFERAFDAYKNRKIVLYGTGRMTAALLRELQGFHIIGLLDRDESMIGQEIYGKRFLSKQEAEEDAELLIINTADAYWSTIYNRICDWKIPIYYCNGQRAERISDLPSIEYWNKSYKELRELLNEYHVISFDIFDTLVMRKILLPTDVFRLTEQRMRGKIPKNMSFVELRRQAGVLLPEADLDELYDKILELSDMAPSLINEIKYCEIEVDRHLITGRNDMISLCIEIMKSKEVYFVSDMYYSSEFLQEILRDQGLLVDQKQIIVSCEHKKSKADGTLWEYVAAHVIGRKKALHVGDNDKSDGLIPQKYGIDSYIIMSGMKMWEHSSMKASLSEAVSLYDSMLIGSVIAKVCGSPFALNETRGRIHFSDLETAGYCLLGGIMYSFLMFLIRQAQKEPVGQLLFFARDGYLLIQLYTYICDLLEDWKLPASCYLEISRRLISVASIASRDEIIDIAMIPYKGDFKEFMQERFGLSQIAETDLKKDVSSLQMSKEVMATALEDYLEDIYDRVKCEKKNYLKYWSGLHIENDFAIVDTFLYGSTQFYFGKFLGKRLNGYYFSVHKTPDSSYVLYNRMKGCFQDEQDLEGTNAQVWKYSKFLESFLTSPDGMVQALDEDGNKVCSLPKSNQKYFEFREKSEKKSRF